MACVDKRPRGTTLIDWQFDDSDGAVADPQPVAASSCRSGSQHAPVNGNTGWQAILPAEAECQRSDDGVQPLSRQQAAGQQPDQQARPPSDGPAGRSIAACFSRQQRRRRHGIQQGRQSADAACAAAPAQMLSVPPQPLPWPLPQVQSGGLDQLGGPPDAAGDSNQPEHGPMAAPSLATAGGNNSGSAVPPTTPQKAHEPAPRWFSVTTADPAQGRRAHWVPQVPMGRPGMTSRGWGIHNGHGDSDERATQPGRADLKQVQHKRKSTHSPERQSLNRRKRQKWFIELFSGSQDVTAFSADQLAISAANCLTIDNEPRTNPKVIADLATFDDAAVHGLKARFGIADNDVVVLWASPPCDAYSRMGLLRRPGPPDLETADRCIAAVFAFIRVLRPIRFFIENPSTGTLSKRSVLLDGLNDVAPEWCRYEVSQCAYGGTLKKQTFVWTNKPLPGFCAETCNPNTCKAILAGRNRHVEDIVFKSSAESSKVPWQLVLCLTAPVVAEIQAALPPEFDATGSTFAAGCADDQAQPEPERQPHAEGAGAGPSGSNAVADDGNLLAEELKTDVAERCMMLREAQALTDDLDWAQRLQRQCGRRLADIISPDIDVALRHTDRDHEDYQYYLLRVTRGLHRLAADKEDDFGRELKAGDLVLEGYYYSFMELDGEVDTSHLRWVRDPASTARALVPLGSVILAGLPELRECGMHGSQHFRQSQAQHARILRTLECIGPGDDTDSEGAGGGGASVTAKPAGCDESDDNTWSG